MILIIHDADGEGREIARYESWTAYNEAVRRGELVRQDGDAVVVRDPQAPWANAPFGPGAPPQPPHGSVEPRPAPPSSDKAPAAVSPPSRLLLQPLSPACGPIRAAAAWHHASNLQAHIATAMGLPVRSSAEHGYEVWATDSIFGDVVLAAGDRR